MIETVVSVELPVDEHLVVKKNRLQPDCLTGKEKRICIITGTHGDELEGQYVCYELIKRIEAEKEIWNTNAFSLYTNATDQIDEESAGHAVTAVLRFLSRMGLIKYNCHGGYIASVLYEQELEVIRSEKAGIYRPLKKPGDTVYFGEKIAEVIHPFEGTIEDEILASTNGVVFFSHVKPLIMQNEVVYKLIRRIHI